MRVTTPPLPHVCMTWCFFKHGDNFNFTLRYLFNFATFFQRRCWLLPWINSKQRRLINDSVTIHFTCHCVQKRLTRLALHI